MKNKFINNIKRSDQQFFSLDILYGELKPSVPEDYRFIHVKSKTFVKKYHQKFINKSPFYKPISRVF